MANAHLHLPHVHVWYPHVGMPDDQLHREETRPSRLGGIVLGIAVVVALLAWATALIALISLGPARAGAVSDARALWTAVAIASAISLFLLGVWKVSRA
ncbi:hypothetical protein [Aeromicrobium sp. 179-A 4D2 NHS]|uniref:hypothetical protein n=1 Tax=Aeromicrobium sp. 179-A 4D2 NHS TaxID=3142375 RepID=UPI0039A0878D